MKKSCLDEIPSRIKYYLLEGKDEYMDDYIGKYGRLRLKDFNFSQLHGWYTYLTIKDREKLKNKAEEAVNTKFSRNDVKFSR